MENKIKALAEHLDVNLEEIVHLFGDTFETDDGEYLVLTDSEAHEAWEESLDQYLDDCLLCELPEIAQQYFDREAWKRDARYDGRGHCLSGYDGEEHEVNIDGEWLYIYRTD